MMSRRTSSDPKEEYFPKPLYSDSRYSEAWRWRFQVSGLCTHSCRQCTQACRQSKQASHLRSQACRQHSQVCSRRSQTCHRCSQMLPWLSPDLLSRNRFSTCASTCTWRPLHWSSKLWDLTTMRFWSANSQTVPETKIHNPDAGM